MIAAQFENTPEAQVLPAGNSSHHPLPDTPSELKELVRELAQQNAELENCHRELKATCRHLEVSRNTLSELYEFAPVGYMDFDEKGYIQQLNRTAADFLGQPQLELIGKPFVRFVSTRDIQKFVAHVRQCLQTNSRRSVELRLRVKDDEMLAVQLWSAPAHQPALDQTFCRTTLSDITERKLAEEALHESKECFRIMTDTAPVFVWVSDAAGLFTYVNKSWLAFTGNTLRQELGNGWLESVHPDDRQNCLDCYKAAFDHRERFNFEFRLRRADKQYRWFLNTGSPRFTPSGAFAGFIGSSVDITERKKAEELRRMLLEDFEVLVQERTANLKAANQKLRQEISTRKRLEKQIVEIADCEKRRIGNDLHDGLGQQLTGVAFLSKVLQQKLSAKNLPESDQAAQVHELVNQALSHTRELARGLYVVELEASGFMTALQEFRSQVENVFNISCQLRCAKSIQIHDPAVATHLYRIAQEAVNNSIKHGKAKNISISLTKADRRIVLTIKDDGIGCPAKALQEKKGMGLHSMKYRTEMIRGAFDIQRGPDGGSIVTCSFPCKANKPSQAQ